MFVHPEPRQSQQLICLVQQRVASAAQGDDAARVELGRFLCEWHQFRLHGAQSSA
jgi:hypothetical protein